MAALESCFLLSLSYVNMHQDSNHPPLYFHCNMCGECCSSWNIPVEGPKAEALLTRPWVQDRLRETRRQLVKIADDFYRIPLTDDNVCVFLAEDKRCMIESHEGLSLKPHECQRFPFATVKMPDGTARHESSAACKLISEKLLLAFEPILPKPEPLNDALPLLPLSDEAFTEDAERFPKRVPVGLWQTLSVEQYEAYQASLHALFAHSTANPADNLKQAARLLKGAPWQQMKAQNIPISRPSPVYPLMGRILTLCFLRKPYRTLSWLSLLVGKTYHDPRVFGMPVNLKQQRAIPWNEAHNPHLNAYAYAILQRKRLLCEGSSLQALLGMTALACLLVQWYAKTLAWLQNTLDITSQDVATAIRLVERYYTGHQPRFMQFFLSRWQGALVERLLLG